MQRIKSFESLVPHLKEKNGSYARSSLHAYFYKSAFTGSRFESFRSDESFKFTQRDIIAVSMLSVNIPSTATRWILEEGGRVLTDLLRPLPPEISITDAAADLTRDQDAWKLWEAIRSLHGMGETKTSKLLATKRPLLFPIYDRHVAKALNIHRGGYWQPWQDYMRSEDGKTAAYLVNEMAVELDVPHLSTLRLLDVVIWMQQHGHKFISKKLVESEIMIPVNYATPK